MAENGTLTLANGMVLTDVPAGTTLEQAQKKFDLWESRSQPFSGQGPNHPTMSSLQSYGRGAADRTANAVANVPDIVAGLMARAATPLANDVQGIKNMATPGEFTGDFKGEQRPPVAFGAPPLGQDFVPGPSGPELLGGVQRLGESAAAVRTGNYDQFSQDPEQDQRSLSQRAMEQNPTAYFLGQVSGDVLSLTTLRGPLARSRATQEHASQRVINGLAPNRRGQQTSGQIARGNLSQQMGETSLAMNVSDALKSISDSRSWRTLTNRAGRAVETGAEAAALSVLNGEADPTESFAYAAGLQGAGSLALGGSASLLSGGYSRVGLKLGMAALATGSLWQVGKELTVGGDDFILESVESGFGKVAMFLTAGLVAGSMGLGRVTPMKVSPEKYSARVSDAFSSVPRAATLSLMTEAFNDPATMTVLEKLSGNPAYFGDGFVGRLERAYLNGNFRNELESLMSNEDFRKKFDAIR